MALLKLAPSFKDYLWGGHRLVDEYNKKYEGDILAESWELSCHPDGPSTIINGQYKGKTLQEYIDMAGKEVLGKNCRRFKDFPILIKFIDARDNLSIQVHPDNKYALKNEGQYGKTEMWYIMDCEEGAHLYYGFKKDITEEEFAKRVEEDTLLEVLNEVYVQKGDVLFIESGTIHAIGRDIVIAEIQQNSNVTYRVYDYGRVGKDGKKRELHVDKALAVTNGHAVKRTKSADPHIGCCDYFVVDKLNLDGRVMKSVKGNVADDSFASILFIDGEGTITCGQDTFSFRKGDSYFISAGSGEYEISGTCEALVTTIGAKADPVRIGIDIGGTNTKIGLVDKDQKLIAEAVIPTEAEKPWKDVIQNIGKEVLSLLDENDVPMDGCVGAGVGMPGTIDTDNGVVLYSNNIRWENVPLAEELQKYLPIPVYVANDADCAALGEYAARAVDDVADCKDMVMITIGTGIGAGIIADGEIYKSRLMGTGEFGHMVIVQDGEQCTCGRKGCLEAYVSATALIRQGKKVMADNRTSKLWDICTEETIAPEHIFEAAKAGDDAASKIVHDYKEKLSTGIVNIANAIRPELILIGGGVASQGDSLLDGVRENLQKYCFGSGRAKIPELDVARLGNKAGVIGAANLVL